jgi:colanic acid/amylovoran biosynthesis protein
MKPSHNATKILVINPNNWYNKGDVSNRLGLIKALKKEFGDKVDITIESLTLKEDAKYFNKFDVKVVESIFSKKMDKNSFYLFHLLTNIKNMLLFMICLFTYHVFAYKPNINHKSCIFFHNLLNSDIVISSPGGFLQDYDIFSSLIPNIFLLISAKFLKKPIIIYAQSLGPFRRKMLRLFMRLILNRVEIIMLREEVSKHNLNETCISNSNVFVTADATFSIEPPPYNQVLYRQKLLRSFQGKAGDVLIGLTVLGTTYFLNKRRHNLLKKYIMNLAVSIDLMITKLNANIVFVPQVWLPSETMMMYMIKRLIKNGSRVLVIDEDLPPEEVMKIIGCMDLLIGTRMHSNIFALIMNVPAIAIAYEHKTHGIMKMLNLGRWVISIEDINGYRLASKIEELYKNRFKIKENILDAIQKARTKSLLSAKIIKAWYERSLKINSTSQ